MQYLEDGKNIHFITAFLSCAFPAPTAINHGNRTHDQDKKSSRLTKARGTVFSDKGKLLKTSFGIGQELEENV